MRRFDKLLPVLKYFSPLKYLSLADRLHYPTMSLDLSDVKRLARLAQLDLNEDQAGKTLDKLNGIFALVEQMRAVDTSGVAPLNHPIAAYQNDVALRLREDVATEPNRRDEYQKVAPATQDGLYLVPKVIE
jgi:aspartyl-tRNA(Asn)/glutamyl-tRNA(Gln) amidotransferase subunit C